MQNTQKTAKNNKQWLAGIAELNAIQGLNADATKHYLFKCGLNVVLNVQKGSKEVGSKLKWQVSISADIFLWQRLKENFSRKWLMWFITSSHLALKHH